jgi:hypothetical protein
MVTVTLSRLNTADGLYWVNVLLKYCTFNLPFTISPYHGRFVICIYEYTTFNLGRSWCYWQKYPHPCVRGGGIPAF